MIEVNRKRHSGGKAYRFIHSDVVLYHRVKFECEQVVGFKCAPTLYGD
jgi:hypothetical protein